ncbi:MAG: hypothetical protein ACI4RP_00050 [Acutalibacteraceae bacterium]
MKMSNNPPLSLIIENARGKFIQTFNQVIDETKLPAYLVEGMLLELLAEVRSRKSLEIITDINAMQNQQSVSEEK